jgi:glutaredoxin 3
MNNKNINIPFIEIYTTQICGYCFAAKRLLKQYNTGYKEINVSHDEESFLKMVQRSNGLSTVPQIFINEKHIGGFDDLYNLHKLNKLPDLIKVSKTIIKND